MNNLGLACEQEAQKFLKKKKYKLLECNYKNKLGEIDIIAKQHNTIVFVEVKSRSSLAFGMPRESVTNHKQQKIKQVAMCYLSLNKLSNCSVRFDVIEILNGQITHIPNAF